MSKTLTPMLSAVCLMLALSPAGARAQMDAAAPPRDTLAATGTAQLQRPPTMLRMHLQLTAKGKTLEEALGALKDRREAARAQLEKLNADKTSITFGNPTVSNAQNAQQRRMEMLVAQRMGSRGAKAKSAKPVTLPVTVVTLLTAQWPIEGDNPDKLLLAGETLREKVKAAALAGPKEAEQLSPAEQELAEEMAEDMQQQRGSGEEPAPTGTPQFLYVARLSPKDRETGLADAFAKAKSQAAELAKAAGVPLGRLVGLTGGAYGRNAFNNEEMGGYGYSRQDYMFMQRAAMQQFLPNAEPLQEEAVSTQPGALAFDFHLTATFAMGK
jgi:hypothetical protein